MDCAFLKGSYSYRRVVTAMMRMKSKSGALIVTTISGGCLFLLCMQTSIQIGVVAAGTTADPCTVCSACIGRTFTFFSSLCDKVPPPLWSSVRNTSAQVVFSAFVSCTSSISPMMRRDYLSKSQASTRSISDAASPKLIIRRQWRVTVGSIKSLRPSCYGAKNSDEIPVKSPIALLHPWLSCSVHNPRSLRYL